MVQRLSFDHGLTDCLPPPHLRRKAMCRKYDCVLIGTHAPRLLRSPRKGCSAKISPSRISRPSNERRNLLA
jgi:hypothetical protein